jgi:hypothetical protein
MVQSQHQQLWLVCLCLPVQAAFGPSPVNPLVETLHQAGAASQYGAVAQHCLASGVLGPLWEEVREGCGRGQRVNAGRRKLILHMMHDNIVLNVGCRHQ